MATNSKEEQDLKVILALGSMGIFRAEYQDQVSHSSEFCQDAEAREVFVNFVNDREARTIWALSLATATECRLQKYTYYHFQKRTKSNDISVR
jgi:hypothetical protein